MTAHITLTTSVTADLDEIESLPVTEHHYLWLVGTFDLDFRYA